MLPYPPISAFLAVRDGRNATDVWRDLEGICSADHLVDVNLSKA
jgi:hypothetical protein